MGGNVFTFPFEGMAFYLFLLSIVFFSTACLNVCVGKSSPFPRQDKVNTSTMFCSLAYQPCFTIVPFSFFLFQKIKSITVKKKILFFPEFKTIDKCALSENEGDRLRLLTLFLCM